MSRLSDDINRMVDKQLGTPQPRNSHGVASPSYQELQEMEERCAKATEGPWHYEVLRHGWRFHSDASENEICGEESDYDSLWSQNPTHENGNFIAHARTDLPRLLQYVRELKAQHIEEAASHAALVAETGARMAAEHQAHRYRREREEWRKKAECARSEERKRLAPWLQHKPDCALSVNRMSPDEHKIGIWRKHQCDCGLAAAIEETK